MKIFLLILLLITIVIVIFAKYKMHQLKNLQKMSTSDMLSYVTKKSNTFVSIAVIENGKTEFYTYGQNNTRIDRNDLQYEIGSISKTMVALLIAKAIKEKKINLSDSIAAYLDLPKDCYYPTIKRLLTHTSGYKSFYFESQMIANNLKGRNDFYGVSKEQLLKKVSQVKLQDSDYAFVYSNFGFSVLGLVLESVYHKEYTELLNDFLHSELGMINSNVASCKGNLKGYWDWAKDDGYIPAGAVISDIIDMSKYLNYYLTSKSTYARMPFELLKTINYSNILYTNIDIHLDKIGMSWIYDSKNKLYWHNGGTSKYNSYIAINEDFSKGIVVLCNYGPMEKIPVTVIGARMMLNSF